jgi:hypothetical protein
MSTFQALADRAGVWRGSKTLYFPDTTTQQQSPTNLTVAPMLGGLFIRLDYTWS